MEIYYTHRTGEIRDEHNRPYTYEQAMAGVEAGTFTDWNEGFATLVRFGGNTSKVDEYYKEWAKSLKEH